jgi:Zn-dependent M28 family amino/carboxypeptidase
MLFTRSDHYSFRDVKTKVFFTASAPKDPYYHTLKDELGTIDFDFLLTATKNIGTACKIFIR